MNIQRSQSLAAILLVDRLIPPFPLSLALCSNHEVTCTEVTPFLCPPQQQNMTAYRHRVRMPWRESGGVENLWYSYTYGLVHFVHINTETDFPGAPMGPGTFWNAGPFGDQLTWLQADLAAAAAAKERGDIAWIVAAGHRPWKSSHKTCAACQAAFDALFYKYSVDLYLSGHVHDYERSWPVAADGSVTQKNYVNPQGIIHVRKHTKTMRACAASMRVAMPDHLALVSLTASPLLCASLCSARFV